MLATWVAKLQIGGTGDLLTDAHLGPIPGAVTWSLVVVFYAGLIAVGVLAKRTYPMGSEAAQAVLKQEPD